MARVTVGTVAVPACPVCGATGRAPLRGGLTDRTFGVAPGTWSLVRCTACGLGRLDPRPADEEVGGLYAAYYTHEAPEPAGPPPGRVPAALRALRNAHLNARLGYRLAPAWAPGRVLARLLPPLAAAAERGVRSLPRGRRVLDVGCGNGAWVAEAAAAGWEAAGIDLDATSVEAGRRAGLDLRVETTAARAAREPGAFDAVTLQHVIEHVADPVGVLRDVRALLRPGGHVWIATPNLAGAGAHRYGADWVHLDPPRHTVLFDHGTLERALRAAGFTDVRRLRPSPVARDVHGVSEAIAAGVVPANPAPVRSVAVRLRALLADALAQLRRTRGEELLVLARRPT